MKYALRLSIVGLALLPCVLHAQWAWTDQNGRKIFSDRPPTAEVPDKNVFKRPAQSVKNLPTATAETSAGAAASPSLAAASSAKGVKNGLELEVAERKKKEELALAAQRKTEQDRIRKSKAENCARVQQAQKSLDSGQRIARTNAQGEREILDDAARAVEAKRLGGIAANECN